jgi:hypothetical protein
MRRGTSLRSLRQVFAGFAFLALGAFGLQALALPIHEARHHATHAQSREQSSVQEDASPCGLCLAAHAHSATLSAAPSFDFIAIFVPLFRGIPVLELPVPYPLSPEARGPPAFV